MTEQNTTPNNDTIKTFREELESTGGQLLDTVKGLIDQGNVRRLIIKDQNDKVLVEMPLTIGVVAGSVVAVLGGWMLAVVGAIAALVARVKIVVERYEDPADADKENNVTIPPQM
jgi:hypothetical protein